MNEYPVDVVAHHPRVIILGRTPREQERVEAFAIDLARWLYGLPRETLGPLARVVTVVAHRELKDPKILCRGRSLLAVEAAARATEALWPLLRGPLEEEEPEPPPPPPPAAGGAGEGEGDESDGGSGEGDQPAAGAPGASAAGQEAENGENEDDNDEDDNDGDENGDENEDENQDEDENEDEDEDDDENESEPSLAPDDSPPTAEDLLAALADQPALDDPELNQLAERLRQAIGGDPKDAMDLGATAGKTLAPAAEAALSGALETDAVSRRLEQFLPGIGWSWSPGQLHHTLLDRLDRLADLVGRLDHLDQLADALGRLEGTEGEGGLDQGGSEEVVGVHLGGEVADALPSELALLGDPDTEDLFYQRFVDRRLISLELEGAGLDGTGRGDKRGPIIACIDTSGSMEGSPEMAAKALVLALCRRVLPQGRTVHLILFSARDDRVELRLRKGGGGLEQLVEFLSLSFKGGTDFDAPLTRAMELLEEEALHHADVLVVTDGLARAGPEMVATVQRARAERGVRVWSVILGQNDPFGVRPFSDEVWRFDPHDAAKASGLLDRFDY